MTLFLLDTNIWLRSVQHQSPHHLLAVEALVILLRRGDEIFITAQNVIEFWSVASRPTEANGFGWPVETVRQEVEQLQAQFPLLDDTAAVYLQWLELVSSTHVTGRRVHDALLVAVMLIHGITHLLTFNADDFRLFPAITVVTPQELGS
jgi:predicted nucleic acid-binding protein